MHRRCLCVALALLCLGHAVAKPRKSSAAAPARASGLSGEDQAQELLRRQQRSADGVISLNAGDFKLLLTGRQRPFHVVFLLTANYLRDKPQLQLAKLRKNFGIAAKAHKQRTEGKPGAGRLFYCELEHSQAQDVFRRLNVGQLPYVVHVGASQAVSGDSTIKVPQDSVLRVEQVGHYPYKPNDFVAFGREKSGVDIGAVDEPTALQHPLFPVLALSFLGLAAWAGTQLYQAPFMQHRWIYACGALVVFGFSVSGGMYNIIRGMPLIGLDPNTRQVMYFSHQGQLGAEGFLAGGLYSTVGLAFGALVWLGPHLKDAGHQRALGYVALAIAVFAFRNVLGLYQWKTGHAARWFIFG